MTNQFDITKHKFSDPEISSACCSEGMLWIYCDKPSVGLNKDDAIATAKHFLHTMKTDEERKDFIGNLLEGICEHCFSLYLPCQCLRDE